jgi:hypothetical protein
MPITDHRALDRVLESRLRAVLSRITPPTPLFADARYRSEVAARSSRVWRLAPALVGIAAIAIMATSATVATGSTNPAVWTERAATTIDAVRHIPDSSPKAARSPKPVPSRPSSQGSEPIARTTPSPNREVEASPEVGAFPEPEATDPPIRTARPGPTPHPTADLEPSGSPSPSSHTPSPTPAMTGQVPDAQRPSDFGEARRF